MQHWTVAWSRGGWLCTQGKWVVKQETVWTEVCKPVILVIPDAPSGLSQLLLSAHMHTQRLWMEVASAGGLLVRTVTPHQTWCFRGSTLFWDVFTPVLYLARKHLWSLTDCLNRNKCTVNRKQTQHNSTVTGRKIWSWKTSLLTSALSLCV